MKDVSIDDNRVHCTGLLDVLDGVQQLLKAGSITESHSALLSDCACASRKVVTLQTMPAQKVGEVELVLMVGDVTKIAFPFPVPKVNL